MSKLRDIRQETDNIIKLLNIGFKDTIIEFGAATGEFACAAARHCKRVIAVDVSANMLEYAKKKSKEKGIGNIDFHGGFLTYRHSGELADMVITQLALHHLPDFWEQVAFKRIFNMLKKVGHFICKDTVYSFDTDNYRQFSRNGYQKLVFQQGGTCLGC